MNAPRAAALLVFLLTAAGTIRAQPRVDPRNMYERVLAIVPLVGAGTTANPQRPMYAPLPTAIDPASRTGILGYTYVLSDDGKFALVEYVARDRSAFSAILADTTIQKFIKGVNSRADIEAAFKALKKNFDFDHFGVRMP